MAYRLLGSLAEAEDAVQDTWLSLSRADPHTISNLGGWLTTVMARVCSNMLHAREARCEESLEACIPASLTSQEGGIDPEEEAELADSVGIALLVVLDQLAPAERLAFVLHDLFAVPFEEIAPLVERDEWSDGTRSGPAWASHVPAASGDQRGQDRRYRCGRRSCTPAPVAPCSASQLVKQARAHIQGLFAGAGLMGGFVGASCFGVRNT